MTPPQPLTREQQLELQRNNEIKENAALRARVEQVSSGHHSACAPAGYTDTEGVPCPPMCHPDCCLQRAEIAESQITALQQQLAAVEKERDAAKEAARIVIEAGHPQSGFIRLWTSYCDKKMEVDDLRAQLQAREATMAKLDGEVVERRACNAAMEATIMRLEGLVNKSLAALYNPFEPDNQSKIYLDIQRTLQEGAP